MALHPAHEAARRLSSSLARLREQRPLILAIPRGGALLAHHVARSLHLPLDLLLAAQVTATSPEVVIGAVALGEARIVDDAQVAALRMSRAEVDRRCDLALEQLRDRLPGLRSDRPMADLCGRSVILIDDAVITGLTMRAALQAVRNHQAARVTIATPICSPEAAERLRPLVDELLALEVLPTVAAIARHEAVDNEICPPLTDTDVRALVLDAQQDAGIDLYGGQETDR